MNVLLWILQIVLALLCFSGGAFKLLWFDQVAQAPWFSALPRWAWSAIGAFEVACGVLLVVPQAVGWGWLTHAVAAATLLECLGLSALYGRYSLKLVGSNPLVFSGAMAVLGAVVAVGRYLHVN
jgi:hypothetical protein